MLTSVISCWWWDCQWVVRSVYETWALFISVFLTSRAGISDNTTQLQSTPLVGWKQIILLYTYFYIQTSFYETLYIDIFYFWQVEIRPKVVYFITGVASSEGCRLGQPNKNMFISLLYSSFSIWLPVQNFVPQTSCDMSNHFIYPVHQ